MKPSTSIYIKEKGYLKICEDCNWDLADINQNLIRETSSNIRSIHRKMAEIRKFIYKSNQHIRTSRRILEIKRKLRGEIYDN